MTLTMNLTNSGELGVVVVSTDVDDHSHVFFRNDNDVQDVDDNIDDENESQCLVWKFFYQPLVKLQ